MSLAAYASAPAKANAAESARAVNAMAYTVGKEIVFGANLYAPQKHEGKPLLAHQLSHVLQQGHGAVASPGNPLRIDLGGTPQEQGAQVAANLALSGQQVSLPTIASRRSHACVQRQPNMPGPSLTLGQWNPSVDERGRVDVTATERATTPVVQSPTIGLRRDPNGQFRLLVGGKDKVIQISDIPALLRQALGGQGVSGTRPKFQVPTCQQLTLHAGKEKNRFMTFSQYQLQQRLFHGPIAPLGGSVWLALSQPLFDALVELCMARLIELPRPPEPEKPKPGDFPGTTLKEGDAFA